MAAYRSYLEQLAAEIQGYRDFNSKYDSNIDNTASQYSNFNNTNQNWKTAQDINKKIAAGDYFDPETDRTYKQYEKSYIQNGLKAADDTLGMASARTGGLASSYATSVAQQTYNNYMQQLANKIPELEQMARGRLTEDYNRYLGLSDKERAALANSLDMYRGLRSDEFNQVYTPRYSHLKDAYSAYKDLEALAMQEEQIAAQKAAQAAAARQRYYDDDDRYDWEEDDYHAPEESDRIWVGGTALSRRELLQGEAEGWFYQDSNGTWHAKNRYDSRGFKLNNPYLS